MNRWIYWIPRILSIIFLLFLAMFSLDVFDGNYGFWGTLVALLMHNIPVLVLLIVLIFAWKHEIIGAVFYALAGLIYIGMLVFNGMAFQFELYMVSWSLTIAGPALLIAGLFYAGWRERQKLTAKE